ncbi:DUF2637 domain-containing protein [Streptomyces sp. NPDC050085]|uniref:DUF2637 domain-containing protein n=1 Tax=Streptomyces sp. NPDC050085 TaxID=3365600 RepID=UPI0037B76A97
MAEDRITQLTVTVVMMVIAALAFVFSFGNVWNLALRLGVPHLVAPLIAPMVDLSVVGLLIAQRYLALRGVPDDQLRPATRLMHLSGLFTLALNVAEPLLAGHYGRACVDAVAPLLLLGWGSVGPSLLRHFHTVTHPDPAPVQELAPTPEPVVDAATAEAQPTPIRAPEPAPMASTLGPTPAVPAPLLDAARSIAASHLAAHGEPITSVQLRARLGVAQPIATAAHAQLTA